MNFSAELAAEAPGQPDSVWTGGAARKDRIPLSRFRQVATKVTPSESSATPTPRIESIDLLRGLDVWLMLFVNEMAGVVGTPAFLRHFPRNGDGMTVTDVVFPAFLFIVGLAVPFAIGGRLRRGEPRAKVWRHVLARTLALLAIGVLMVNGEEMSNAGPLSPPLWTASMLVGVVLVWKAPGADVRRTWIVRGIGIALLFVLVLLYQREGVTSIVQIRPSWWGILGLIGWAYFVVATAYLRIGDRPALLVAGVSLLYCLYLASEAGYVPLLAMLRPYFDVGRAVASHAAVTLSGTLLGVMVVRARAASATGGRLFAAALGYAGALAAAAFLLHSLRGLHPAFWIDKVKATVPWCLYSSAWTCVAWALLYLLADVRGWRRWPASVTMAGENALVAYMMAPFLLSLFALGDRLFGVNPYEALGGSTAVGFVRSLAFAWIVVRLCGLLRAGGIRMQL
jgi:heparan-alpha-glucosaminide N-acetyltransferase